MIKHKKFIWLTIIPAIVLILIIVLSRNTTPPNTTLPDTTLPNTTLPDTTLPNTTLPDTTLPNTTSPNTTLPNTTPSTYIPPADSVQVEQGRPEFKVIFETSTNRINKGFSSYRLNNNAYINNVWNDTGHESNSLLIDGKRGGYGDGTYTWTYTNEKRLRLVLPAFTQGYLFMTVDKATGIVYLDNYNSSNDTFTWYENGPIVHDQTQKRLVLRNNEKDYFPNSPNQLCLEGSAGAALNVSLPTFDYYTV